MKDFRIDSLIQGTLKQLSLEAEYFSSATEHRGEIGRLNELHLVKALRRYLPSKFGIGTGFIVSASPNGTTVTPSPQCDIIIYDNLNNAAFYHSDAWQIYPIEMVYGVIEVKTNANKKDIYDTVRKCAEIRNMCGDQIRPRKWYLEQYIDPESPYVKYRPRPDWLPPRFFLFSYNCSRLGLAKKHLETASAAEPNSYLHGICTISKEEDYFCAQGPATDSGERFTPFEKEGLLRFLLELPLSLDGMLPAYNSVARHVDSLGNEEFGTFSHKPICFDRAFARRYRAINVPELVSERNVGPQRATPQE